MKQIFRYLFILVLWLFQVSKSEARVNEDTLLKQYDETIFVISNFSGVDANLNEPKTVQELLSENIGGFRFYLEWEKQANQLMIKRTEGTSIPFKQTVQEIKAYLDQKHEKIITLFLDFGTNVNELNDVLQDVGINQYLYTYDEKDGWPTIRSMIESNHRLVIFSMQEHRNSPEWLHYIWNHAVEPYFSIWDAPVFKGEFLKGDPKNSLLIYNDYNFPQKSEMAKNLQYDTNQNPYLIEHIKNTWVNTGKTPNFIMLDRYAKWIVWVLSYVRGFKTIK